MTDIHTTPEHSTGTGASVPADTRAGTTDVSTGRSAHASHAASWGLLLLRVVLGITLLMHGWQKVSEWGLSGTAESFEGMGIPAPAASAVFAAVVELAGGVALILGVLTHVAGILLALDMIGALALVHASEGFFAADGGFEYVLLLAAASLALALTGPGRFAVARALPGRGAGSILA